MSILSCREVNWPFDTVGLCLNCSDVCVGHLSKKRPLKIVISLQKLCEDTSEKKKHPCAKRTMQQFQREIASSSAFQLVLCGHHGLVQCGSRTRRIGRIGTSDTIPRRTDGTGKSMFGVCMMAFKLPEYLTILRNYNLSNAGLNLPACRFQSFSCMKSYSILARRGLVPHASRSSWHRRADLFGLVPIVWAGRQFMNYTEGQGGTARHSGHIKVPASMFFARGECIPVRLATIVRGLPKPDTALQEVQLPPRPPQASLGGKGRDVSSV